MRIQPYSNSQSYAAAKTNKNTSFLPKNQPVWLSLKEGEQA